MPNSISRNNAIPTPFDVASPSPPQPVPAPVTSPQPQPKTPSPQPPGLQPKRNFKLGKIVLVVLALAVLIGGSILLFRLMNPSPDAVNSQRSEDAATAFDTLDIPLNEVALEAQILTGRTLNINGQLKVDRSLILTPSTQPTSGIAGQMYYDSTTNQLNYYNGTGFVALGSNPQTVTSIGGASGTLTLGGGLSLSGNTLSSTGIVSIASASTNLTVTNDGGNVTITNTPGAPQGVQSVGGTNGRIALFNGAQTIGDSLLNQTGSLLTANANLQVNGAIELQAADTVTLRLTDTTSGVIGQIYNDGNLHVNGGQNNLWLDAGGSGTIFMNAANGNKVAIGQAIVPTYLLEVNGDINISDAAGSLRIGGTAICTITGCISSGGGGAGVTSLNGIDGALTLSNATAAGTTITIDDATTTAKGIASFNNTNFTVTSGAVNTIQDINTTAAPTFGQLALTSSQATAAMLTINNTNASATGNLLDLQLNGTSEFAVGPTGNVTLNGTINGQTISSAASFTGTLGVTGNINTGASLFANAVGVTTNLNVSGTTSTNELSVTANAGVGGNLTVTGTMSTNTITPTSALTVGSTGQAFTLQGSATSTITATGGGFTTTVGFAGIPTGNLTYNFDRAATPGSYTICTTVGNCAGSGSGVTTPGGTGNRLAKFTAGQTIADSTITDDGTNVTTSVDLVIQGGDVTIGVANTQTGSLNLAQSGSGFLGTISQSALTANRTYLLPDASGTFCLTSGNCSGSGSSNTLQASYDAGNTITTTNARNILFTLSDQATDPNFLVNLECDTSCSTNGRFAVQDDGVDVFTISPAGGAAAFQNATNSTTAFQVRNAAGTVAVLGVDTSNVLVRVSGAGSDASLTSGTGAVQIGSDTGANLAFDDNEIIARNNGSTSTLFLQNGGGGLNVGANSSVFQVVSNGDSLTVLNASGNRVINVDTAEGELELGSGSTINGTLLFRNSANGFITTLRAPSPTAHRAITLPDADGVVCLQNSTSCGFALSNGSASYIQNQSSADQTADLRISGTARANTSVLTPSVDTVTAAALNVGGTIASAVNVGRSGINTTITGNLVQNTGTFSLTGNNTSSISTTTNALTLTSASTATWSTTSGSLTLQSTNASNNIVINGGSNTMTLNTGSSGSITLGSANTSTINLGALTNNARTVNVGVGTGGTQTQTVNVGSLGGSSVTNIRGGTTANAIALTTGTGGVITATATQTAVKALADNTSAFQVQNASGGFLFNVDTLNNTANLLWGTFGTGAGLDFSIDTFFSDAVLIGTGLADNVSLGNSAASINLTTGSNITAKSAVNNTSAFRVQNAANTSIFEVDTVNGASNTSYLNVNTSFNSSYRLNVAGLSKIYRATSTAADNLLELNSDVGGVNSLKLNVAANGDLTTAGKITVNSLGGAGLTDCDASNSKILWDSTTSLFSCGTDRASVTVRKSADESVTSSTTLQNDNELTFNIGANETYIFHINVNATMAGAGSMRYTVTAPSGATCNFSSFGADGAGSAAELMNANCGTVGTYQGGGTASYETIDGTVTTGATPGTVTLQWAQDSSNATPTTVKAGSSLVAYKVSGADLAEAYYTKDSSIAAGTVVSLDPTASAGVVKSNKPYDTKSLGVISTNPGQVLADPQAGTATGRPVLVALSGRIPVKVSAENGAIRAGDFLTTSSTPGVAMKATRPGQVIGRALSDYDGAIGNQGTVLMFASQQWADPRDPDGHQLQSDLLQSANIANLTAENATFDNLTVKNNANFLGDVAVRGNVSVAKLTVNGHIVTGGDTPAVSTDACNGATAEISGTDTAGTVTVTAAAGCNGDLATVNFAKAFDAAPRVTLTPANASASQLQTYVDSGRTSATSFTIATPTTINGSTTYRWYYQVLQ